MEAGTFRFRDPLNQQRRFIPLRLDDTPIKGSLAQFLYISWRPQDREQAYAKLLDACRPPAEQPLPATVLSEERPPIPAKRAGGLPKPKMTKSDGNAIVTTSLARRTTVWVLGSYSELETSEVTIARKMIATLGSGLAARGVRLVTGKSDMLDDLAGHCRNVAMAMSPRGPLPIILDGKLRQTDLKTLFRDTIGGIPNLAIVIGGGVSRGRVAEECDAAEEAGIPILPVPVTGGAAARVRLTAHIATDLYEVLRKTGCAMDTNDLVAALLQAVELYAPNAQQACSPAATTISKSHPSEPLTRLEIHKLVNRYIGVNGGYLGDFTYRAHDDFYLELNLDIDPHDYAGTTRARFIQILSESAPDVQARILDGILDKYPVGSSELRTQERRDEIAGWIVRLRA